MLPQFCMLLIVSVVRVKRVISVMSVISILIVQDFACNQCLNVNTKIIFIVMLTVESVMRVKNAILWSFVASSIHYHTYAYFLPIYFI